MKKIRVGNGLNHRMLSVLCVLTLLIFLKEITPTTASNDDSWRSRSSLPTKRAYLAAAAVGGKIYAIGGEGGGGVVEEYDPATDSWQSRADMPTPRSRFAVAVVNGKIYAIGGWGPLSIVEEYDPATNQWHNRTPMPTARYGLAAVAVDGKIYAIGGHKGTTYGGYFSTVEVYDPATDSWTSGTAMSKERVYLAAAVVDEKIYAIGGSYGMSRLSTVEEYNPATDMWTPKTSMPTARSNFAAVAVGGRLYAIGGADNQGRTTAVVEEYDPVTNSWQNRASLPKKRSSLTAAMMNGKIYAIGGEEPYHQVGKLSNVEEYDPPFYDTDGDGLADDDELGRYKTDPFVSDADVDMDGDGLLNVDEIDRYGTDPLVPDIDIDTDGDGLTNLEEVNNYNTNPISADTDLDGLSDGEEVEIYNTDPLEEDSDNDNYSDAMEVTAGTDPNDPEDHPTTTTTTLPVTTTTTTPPIIPVTTYPANREVDTLAYGEYLQLHFLMDPKQNWQVIWSFTGSNAKVGITALVMTLGEHFKWQQGYSYEAYTLSTGTRTSDSGTFTIPYTGQWTFIFLNNDPDQQSTTVTIILQLVKTTIKTTTKPTNTAPTVRVIQPNGGERISGTYEIKWYASDAEGDTLTFTVYYKTPEVNWIKMASGLTETTYMWDTSSLETGDSYMIKVEASDGVHTVVDASDRPFIVRGMALEESGLVPSFRLVESLGAILILFGLWKWRQRMK